jgi:hypothetical protein
VGYKEAEGVADDDEVGDAEEPKEVGQAQDISAYPANPVPEHSLGRRQLVFFVCVAGLPFLRHQMGGALHDHGTGSFSCC